MWQNWLEHLVCTVLSDNFLKTLPFICFCAQSSHYLRIKSVCLSASLSVPCWPLPNEPTLVSGQAHCSRQKHGVPLHISFFLTRCPSGPLDPASEVIAWLLWAPWAVGPMSRATIRGCWWESRRTPTQALLFLSAILWKTCSAWHPIVFPTSGQSQLEAAWHPSLCPPGLLSCVMMVYLKRIW